ncbi:unnamed protein product, partial [Polarella glacialis]
MARKQQQQEQQQEQQQQLTQLTTTTTITTLIQLDAGIPSVSPLRTRRFLAHLRGGQLIGVFSTELEAARAFDKASRAEGGRTNFFLLQQQQQLSAVTKLYSSRLLGTPNTTTIKQQQQQEKLFVPCSSEVYDLAQLPAVSFEARPVGGLREAPPELDAQDPVESWVLVRCRAEMTARTAELALARSRLENSSSALAGPGVDFEAQRRLWQEYLDAEREQGKSRAPNASEWRFQAEDSVRLSPWCEEKENQAVLRSTSDDFEQQQDVVMAVDLPEMIVLRIARGTQNKQRNKAIRHLAAQLNSVIRVFGSAMGDNNQSWLLSAFSGNEAQSRMLIDIILLELCRQHNLSLSPEEALPASAPVPGVADYVLRRAGGSEIVAVVEAKRCIPSSSEAGRGQEAWAALLTDALAQTLALVAGLATACGPLGVVTDARNWLLVELPAEGPPSLQCWPCGALVLQLSGPGQLELLLQCLGQLL